MKFSRSLYARLALALTFVLVLVGGGLFALSTWAAWNALDALNQDLHENLAKNLVSEQLIYVDGEINEEALEEIFHDLMVVNPAIECYLLDLEGRIVRYSAPPESVRLDRVDVSAIQTYLEEPGSRPIRGDDPKDPGRRRVFTAAPVMVEDAYEGYLYVILGGQEYAGALEMVAGNYAWRVGMISAAGVLLFGLVSGLILFRVLTWRLERLSRAMAAFASSGFEKRPDELERVNERPRDEIDLLTARFRDMSCKISELVDRLRSQDSLRRELVANVSHDLRTPLASLKGYLETLTLKGSELSEEDRARYLDVAIRQADRLSRLVEDLFELAKLDARHSAPEIEPFPLDELVMDLLQKFELTAESRSIRLEARLGGPLPRAKAEIGLIERALENLIDNALRHTPGGGCVTVRLEARGSDVAVRIEDSGPGIPEEDLERLFDPFFRIERETRGAGDGAGLGLAIVKRILELHGQRIEVESAVGRGTVFSFRLAGT